MSNIYRVSFNIFFLQFFLYIIILTKKKGLTKKKPKFFIKNIN